MFFLFIGKFVSKLKVGIKMIYHWIKICIKLSVGNHHFLMGCWRPFKWKQVGRRGRHETTGLPRNLHKNLAQTWKSRDNNRYRWSIKLKDSASWNTEGPIHGAGERLACKWSLHGVTGRVRSGGMKSLLRQSFASIQFPSISGPINERLGGRTAGGGQRPGVGGDRMGIKRAQALIREEFLQRRTQERWGGGAFCRSIAEKIKTYNLWFIYLSQANAKIEKRKMYLNDK